MIYIIIAILRDFLGLKLSSVFAYTSSRMALAALTSFCTTLLLGPFFIHKLYELKIGESIRSEDCPLLGKLHEKKKNTPTMGGLLMLFSMLISLFLWMDLSHSFTLILALCTIWLGSLGAYDDFLKLKYKNSKGLSMRWKFFFQMLLSAIIISYLCSSSLQGYLEPIISPPFAKDWMSGKCVQLHSWDYIIRLYLPFVKTPWLLFSGTLGFLCLIAFLFCVISGSSNAVNLSDGLDGLACGCLMTCAASISCLAFLSNHSEIARYLNILYIDGSAEIAIYLAALMGACLGFLWFNCHPAQVFMGDTGSLALGGIIGVSALLLKRELLLALTGSVFVLEAVSVILQVASFRLRNKKRIFLCAPLHHHYEYKGWHENKIVVRFWIISLLMAIIGLASIKFQ